MRRDLATSRERRPPAVIHLDLDGAAVIYTVRGWVYSAPTDPLFLSGVERALELFDEAGVRATFFVVARDVDDPAKRRLVEEAAARGHEIASHSLTHRLLGPLPRSERLREVRESRQRIMDRIGVDVRGFRAPFYSIDREILEMLAAAGYGYDSSVFPTGRFARRLGVPRVSAAPHRPLPGLDLVELPLPDHRPLPLPFHPSYSLVAGRWYFRLGLRRFRASAAPLVFLFHLTDVADPLPPAYVKSWRQRFFTLSHISVGRKLESCRAMLQAVEQQYDIVSTPDLLKRLAPAPPANSTEART